MLFKNLNQATKAAVRSAVGHLLASLVMIIIAALLSWVWPVTKPYVIAWAICACLCIMSVWDAANFDLQARHIYAYLVAIALLVITFLFGTLDWVTGWNVIPAPWRYVAVFESLPLAILFLFFIALIVDCEDTSMSRGWPKISAMA
jgi:hypothetical protein